MEEAEPDLETLMRVQRRLYRPWPPRPVAPAAPDPVLDALVGEEFEGEPSKVTMSLALRDGFTITVEVFNDQNQIREMLADGWVEVQHRNDAGGVQRADAGGVPES